MRAVVCCVLLVFGCDDGDAAADDALPPVADAALDSGVAGDATPEPDGSFADGGADPDLGVDPDAAPGPEYARCAPGNHAPPVLESVRRVVVLGDGVAESPNHPYAFPGLLAANPDALFPAWAGLDLATRLPGATLTRWTSAGLSYRAVAEDAAVACGDACLVEDDASLLVVQLGSSDLINLLVSLATDPIVAEDPTAALAPFEAWVEATLALADAPAHFTTRPGIYVFDVPDPTDGSGRLTGLGGDGVGLPIDDIVDPEAVQAIIRAANAAIHSAADRCGATVVEAHDAFLGHGLEADDVTNPNFDLADPSYWLLSVTEPNLRGAHELRRVLWATITGDAPDAAPNLPLAPPPGTLPEVPGAGWANAVVENATSETVAGNPNVARDAEQALGEPTGGTSDVVALGEVGGSITLDLGEGEEALDGDGDDLVVWEAGLQSGGAPEPYRVWVAEAVDGPWFQLGDGAGERAFDFAGTPVGPVRYVRVESLRLAVDVARSLGSIYFPGGEIDAVGAVHLP